MIPRYDIDIVRGDTWERVVGLAGFALDGTWQGRFALREAQDDALADLYTLTGPIDLAPDPDPMIPDVSAVFTIRIPPTDTQTLPPYDLVCYCELRKIDASDVRRLFEGRVKVRD